MSKADSIPTKFPEKLVEEMDSVVEEGWYSTRSEFVRDAVRARLRSMKTEKVEEAIKDDVRWGLDE